MMNILKPFHAVAVLALSALVSYPSSLHSRPASGELDALQARIDSVSAAGGGRVTLERREYMLRGSLRLKSGVELHVPEGAVLRFSGEPDDFLPVVPTRWEGTELMGRSAMIYTNGQRDVSITGGGIIDANGGKMARWGMAPEATDDGKDAKDKGIKPSDHR